MSSLFRTVVHVIKRMTLEKKGVRVGVGCLGKFLFFLKPEKIVSTNVQSALLMSKKKNYTYVPSGNLNN